MALIKLKQLDTILTGSLQVSGSAGVTGSLSVSSDAILQNNLAVTGHITASGNISSSGTIYADNFQSTGGDSAGISFADDLNITGHITGSGNLEIAGNISGSVTSTGSFGYMNVSGDTVIGGNLTLGDADTDSVSFGAEISSSMVPDADSSYDIGSSSKNWRYFRSSSFS